MENPWIVAARFIGIGWLIVLLVVGGVVGGRWIGHELGNETFFTLVGLVVGLTLAGYAVYESYQRILKSQENDNDKEEK
jgi:hypothetical protein